MVHKCFDFNEIIGLLQELIKWQQHFEKRPVDYIMYMKNFVFLSIIVTKAFGYAMLYLFIF